MLLLPDTKSHQFVNIFNAQRFFFTTGSLKKALPEIKPQP
jgi:hypothetical protein